MINIELFPKAYKEVTEILKYIPEESFRKIPNYIVKYFEENQDNSYNYVITHFDDFENQKMLKETETILAVIFRNYLATAEQRKNFREKEIYEIQLLEKKKREKYNPDDIFKRNTSTKIVSQNYDKKEENSYNYPAIVEPQNIINKIIVKIKKFFHIDYKN